MKKSQDELRYSMWKRVVSEVRDKADRGSIFSTYAEVLNKCKFSPEFDDTLDSIIENERLIKIGKK
jgi:hypothetical protein